MNSTKAHVDKVIEAAQSSSAAARSRLAASWRRSMDMHGLDPADMLVPTRVDAMALRQRRELLDHFLQLAAPKLDHLFSLVGNSGCAVLLTDADGVVLDQRCQDGDADAFISWGLWQGADWSEAVQGTNGIGTCLTENRRVVIHREDHFLARNTAMSCMDVPIHGPDGRLIAALDVSSARADQTEAYNKLIVAMVGQTVRQIETDVFRAAYHQARIVMADHDDAEAAMLLAINGDDIVVGATRGARKAFGLAAQGPLTPLAASDLFGDQEGPTGFARAERAAVVRALTRADGNVSEAARALGIGRATLYRRMKRLGLGDRPGEVSQD